MHAHVRATMNALFPKEALFGSPTIFSLVQFSFDTRTGSRMLSLAPDPGRLKILQKIENGIFL